jgi:hypothetical protein
VETMRVVLTQGSQDFVTSYSVVRSTVRLLSTIGWKVEINA